MDLDWTSQLAEQLDGHWRDQLRALTSKALAAPCGAAEGAFSGVPMAALVLHINRETIHHGAEIALLRDLYLRQAP